MAKKTKAKVAKASRPASSQRVPKWLAILALIINIIIPGIGTLIAGRAKEAVSQVSLLVLGWLCILLGYNVVGVPLYVIAWIWGIISGASLIKEAF